MLSVQCAVLTVWMETEGFKASKSRAYTKGEAGGAKHWRWHSWWSFDIFKDTDYLVSNEELKTAWVVTVVMVTGMMMRSGPRLGRSSGSHFLFEHWSFLCANRWHHAFTVLLWRQDGRSALELSSWPVCAACLLSRLFRPFVRPGWGSLASYPRLVRRIWA